MDLRRKSSSQENRTGYGTDSKFKWDIVPGSLPPCRFRTGWSHRELQRRIPIGRITSSLEALSLARARTLPLSSVTLRSALTSLRLSLPFGNRSWVFHASDKLYLTSLSLSFSFPFSRRIIPRINCISRWPVHTYDAPYRRWPIKYRCSDLNGERSARNYPDFSIFYCRGLARTSPCRSNRNVCLFNSGNDYLSILTQFTL